MKLLKWFMDLSLGAKVVVMFWLAIIAIIFGCIAFGPVFLVGMVLLVVGISISIFFYTIFNDI